MRYVIGILIAVAFAAILVAAVKGSIEEHKQWEAFKTEHQCVVIGRKQGSTSVSTAVGVNSEGGVTVTPITTTIPSQTAWECNDGITYWRNN